MADAHPIPNQVLSKDSVPFANAARGDGEGPSRLKIPKILMDKKSRDLKAARLNSRMARLGVPGQVAGEDLLGLYVEQSGLCVYCRRCIFNLFSMDHRLAVSQGGENTRSNLQLLCVSCNARKNNRTPNEAFEYYLKRATDAAALKASLDRLKLSSTEAARRLLAGEGRKVDDWLSGRCPIPASVILLLREWEENEIAAPSEADSKDAIGRHAINLIRRAESAGWTKQEAIQGVCAALGEA